MVAGQINQKMCDSGTQNKVCLSDTVLGFSHYLNICHWNILLTLQSYNLIYFVSSLCGCLSIGYEALAGKNVTPIWSHLEDENMYSVLIKERIIHTSIKIRYIILSYYLCYAWGLCSFLHLYLVSGTDGEDSLLWCIHENEHFFCMIVL